jgi:hypothetical protein
MDGSYVGKPCPKCAHIRAASEAGLDWQCPKCGIAYAKFQQAQSAPASDAAFRAAGAGTIISAPAGQSNGIAIFGHLSILLGFIIPLVNIIAPIAIIRMKRGEDELAVACAREAINFQISILLWWLLVLGLALLGFLIKPAVYLAIPLMVVVLLCSIVLPIVAAVKASRGESYYYPLTWHIFK